VKKSIVVLLVLVFLTASCLSVSKPVFSSASGVAENTWTQKAPMQTARDGLGVAVVNGKIYAIGGFTESGVVGTNEEYDPETDTWTLKKPMPNPRQVFAVAVYQNEIYCLGGTTDDSHWGTTEYSAYSNVIDVYDPATDTWVTKPHMPTARLGLQANVVNGKIYLIGGLPQSDLNEVYDPANNTWETKAPLPTSTGGFVSAVVNNKIYSVGTYYNGSYIPTTQIYDPDTNAWSTGAPPPSSIDKGGYSVAAATTGIMAPKRIYVYDGLSLQVYDPQNDSWTFAADHLPIRNRAAIGVVNDMLYVIGGYTLTYPNPWTPVTTYYATNEQYAPFGYGTSPPVVSVVSPENTNYNSSSVSLAFTVNKPVAWLGYSLDGRENVTVNGNATIAGLPNGLHSVTVYAKDSFENTGASETISFSVEVPFPVVPVAAASVAAIVAVGMGLLVYFKKRGREAEST
jgi:N-acetylneuraminic acid mutarotase